MATIIPQRMTAKVEGDFVVFVIGMRINRPWKIHKWVPIAVDRLEIRDVRAARRALRAGGAGRGRPAWRAAAHP